MVSNGGAPISVSSSSPTTRDRRSPSNDARTEAAIAEAKRTVPGKPIRYLVNTHGHFDHSGGLRGFVAEGITIVTHQLNKPYFEQILAFPHTINPDRLARAPRAPVIEGVADVRVLSDSTRTLALHHVRGNLHNDTLLMAYLPKEKLLMQADAFAARPPGARPLPPGRPFTVNLWENIQRPKPDVEKRTPARRLRLDGRADQSGGKILSLFCFHVRPCWLRATVNHEVTKPTK